ncbi:abscission/NoCut checkpoint regulator isoform X2 [Periplaneta americana]|uniref:abscission/NoCut checkpoint regulator isoform X2 n=1 Tax=Periplaneta americana TaxID=6978 RepID=UPI0037E93CF6
MSCHGCTSKFSLFNKEKGCPNCGFSYCSKCLKFKVSVPKLDGSEHKVCRMCLSALSENSEKAKSAEEEYCPPESFLTRLESLENPARPPITLYRQNSRMQQLKKGLSQEDCEIAERLERLREERKRQPIPSEEEVAKRLAILKGEEPDKMAAKKNLPTPDTLTNQEKADNLLQQYFEEQELSAKLPDPADEIAQRLAKLRGQNIPSNETCKNSPANETSKTENKILNVVSGNTSTTDDGNQDATLMDDVNTLMKDLEKEMTHGMHEMKELNKDIKKRQPAAKLKVMLSEEKQGEEREESSDEEVQETIQKVLDKIALEEEENKIALEDNTEDQEEELPLLMPNLICFCLQSSECSLRRIPSLR